MTAFGKLFRTTAFKIALAYLVFFAVGSGFILVHIGWEVSRLLDEQIAVTVDTDINGLTEQYAQGGLRQVALSVDRRARQPGAGLYLLTTFAGEPISGNIANLPPRILDEPGLTETTYERPGETRPAHRALVRVTVLPGNFRLLVGHDLEEGESVRKVLSRALFTSLFWLVIIGTLGGLWAARRVLRRVDKINAHAQTIMVAGDLTGRLPLAGTDDELDRLVENLNAMLDRIAGLMDGLREVSENIAHDLKTPLTRLRGNVEGALRAAQTPATYRATLDKVLEDSDALIRIFDALLMIARAEAGARPDAMEAVDASAIVRDVGELYDAVAEERGMTFEVAVAPGLVVRGNRELIGQAVANLVDNALKYGVGECASAMIRLAATRADGTVNIIVADRGPGIAREDRTRVLDRFVRLETARSRPGSGLGLSLAAAVAHLHGGTVRLEDNAPGLRAVLSLPALDARALPAAALPTPSAAA